ncbi:hypothetical protein [Parahaliea mediterranea]|uniref:hypothetical protein n=1 Tax=Parahaliea mediterranea TaxID=651086 RepID=UPI0013002037|nr:hypothetical protein [Parahaliea mediterranea]
MKTSVMPCLKATESWLVVSVGVAVRFLLGLSGFLALVSGANASADTEASFSIDQPVSGSCEKVKNATPLCLFSNPEDMAILPGNRWLLVSEYGDYHGSRPGALVFYDLDKKKRRIAYDGDSTQPPGEYWGDPSCIEAPGAVFSPHGIDLKRRKDGRWQLLVVQHGGRESIEFFELVNSDHGPSLLWRGCAIAPDNASLNSVAAGADGELFTTKMMASKVSWGSDSSESSGLVFRWTGRSGFEVVPGSEGLMLNGIAASKDGRSLYVVYSGENVVKKIDSERGIVIDSTPVKSADNIKWSADGETLLVASFVGSQAIEDFAHCTSAEVGVCPIAFSIIELEPEQLAKKTLFDNRAAPMGAGTVGIKVKDTLFIGTFSGNRILQVELPAPAL